MHIFAGIVLYNPDLERLKKSLDSILPQVKRVVLVDNSSKNIDEISKISSQYNSILLIKNNKNQGIATALNQICQAARNNDAEWVLTLDQDTVCPSDIIRTLSVHGNDNIGIICPAVNYEGLNINKKEGKEEISSIGACMTSGSLTNLRAWEKVGGFREDYFIDFVDNDFCMKLHINGYDVIRVHSCVMNHQLGTACEKRLLGIFKRKVCLHSPWRFYYMTRNNLVFIWQYKSQLNVIKEYLKLGSILWHGVINADNKKETLHYITKGMSDARHHKMGELN